MNRGGAHSSDGDALGVLTPTAAKSPAAGEAAPAPVQPRVLRLTVEHACWVAVALIAAALRLLSLDATPLGAIEGSHALGTWLATQGRPPAGWGGSLTEALTALVFKAFGAGDAGARVVPALAGMALVLSLWALRPHIGRMAALAAALLAVLSPTLVAEARAASGESLGMALAIIFAALLLDSLEKPEPKRFVALMILLTWGLGTDGTFVAGAGLALLWAALRLTWLRDADTPALRPALAQARDRLVRAAPIAAAGLLLACSRWGLGLARLRPAALAQWNAMFQPSRPNAPWHYAIDVAIGYELPLLILGVAGAIWAARAQRWRHHPVSGLLLIWTLGGTALALFGTARQPSTLLLLTVALCLLGGIAVDRGVRALLGQRPRAVDLLIAAAIVLALVYTGLRAGAVGVPSYSVGAPSRLLVVLGPVLLFCFLVALYLRWEYLGNGALMPSAVVLGIAAIVWNLHGASAVAFLRGDEFMTGVRTTREGVALARLLEAQGGGIGDVDSALQPDLGWYLRDTLASGGHGGAKLIPAAGGVPAGYRAASQPALVARAWSPHTLSGAGMVRWWLYRQAWGSADDKTARLVVEGR